MIYDGLGLNGLRLNRLYLCGWCLVYGWWFRTWYLNRGGCYTRYGFLELMMMAFTDVLPSEWSRKNNWENYSYTMIVASLPPPPTNCMFIQMMLERQLYTSCYTTEDTDAVEQWTGRPCYHRTFLQIMWYDFVLWLMLLCNVSSISINTIDIIKSDKGITQETGPLPEYLTTILQSPIPLLRVVITLLNNK